MSRGAGPLAPYGVLRAFVNAPADKAKPRS